MPTLRSTVTGRRRPRPSCSSTTSCCGARAPPARPARRRTPRAPLGVEEHLGGLVERAEAAVGRVEVGDARPSRRRGSRRASASGSTPRRSYQVGLVGSRRGRRRRGRPVRRRAGRLAGGASGAGDEVVDQPLTVDRAPASTSTAERRGLGLDRARSALAALRVGAGRRSRRPATRAESASMDETPVAKTSAVRATPAWATVCSASGDVLLEVGGELRRDHLARPARGSRASCVRRRGRSGP